MRFHYIAFQSTGKVVEGNADGKDQAEVLAYLAKSGLRPISVKPLELGLSKYKKSLFGAKISLSDKIFLTKYLSLMLKVGTDLFKAIDILIADFDKPAVKALMLEIRGSLERGEPFHTTFLHYSNFFSPVFVNLIKAGETSGSLDHVLEDLSTSLEKESDLRSRLRGALVYPILLLVMAFLILTFLVTFALPKIADVFSGGGFNPPIFSRIVFAIGLFLGKYIVFFWGAGILIIGGLFLFFKKSKTGPLIFGRILSTAPLIKNVTGKLALQRFASTFSSLLKSGLPILDSLEITAQAVGQADIRDALRRISREGISRGLTVGDSFKREKVFPAVVSNLVAVSEKAGHLDEILKSLGDFYEKEIDSSVKTLVSFLEPALLIVIGFIVAVIALSIIVPIYQLVGQI